MAEEHKHDYSSTQIELSTKLAKLVRELANEIPDSDLSEDGREDVPHVTVKYGLHTNDVKDVIPVVKDEPPVSFTLGKTSLFPSTETGKDYEVVKVDVDSADLHRLNARIAAECEHTDTHPEYKPHVTVAYVKTGKGKKYVGLDLLDGHGETVKEVIFSDKDGNKQGIGLSGDPVHHAIRRSVDEFKSFPIKGNEDRDYRGEKNGRRI